jgi:hypothetical protein
MLYKPKYCCHCGEEIERIEWFPWTSRRFCETCATENKIYDWFPVSIVVFGILLSIFGLGTYLKSGEKQLPAAVKQKTTDISKSSQNPANQKIVSQVTANAQPLLQQPAVNNQIKPLSQIPKTQTIQTENAPKEAAYFCGAQTKKGTPCSRRVKNGGRCWQHREQPAISPEN